MKWLVLLALAACDGGYGYGYDDGGTPYCWIYTCPSDPDASVCGTCVHHGTDDECPPGFVCACSGECVKGPRTYDAGSCPVDAGGTGPTIDARIYDWPACDQAHLPGDNL